MQKLFWYYAILIDFNSLKVALYNMFSLTDFCLGKSVLTVKFADPSLKEQTNKQGVFSDCKVVMNEKEKEKIFEFS